MAPRETEIEIETEILGWQAKSIMVCYGISGVVNYSLCIL